MTGSIASTPPGPGASSTIGRRVPSLCVSEEQRAQFAQIVAGGPDREKGGVVRWRRVDLKRIIAKRFGVDFHPRYVGKLLHKLGFSHINARPRQPAEDERTVEAFKNVWPAPSARDVSRLAADPVCFNVSGVEELPPAMMEIRTLRSSQNSRRQIAPFFEPGFRSAVRLSGAIPSLPSRKPLLTDGRFERNRPSSMRPPAFPGRRIEATRPRRDERDS